MNTNVVMICFGIFYIAMAACLGYSTAAIINLRKDLKADKQLFGVILNKTSEITNHCNKVMQLMDGTIDMLRKEHDLHNQAVDAMNETMTASHEVVCSFYKLKDELENCSSKVEKLNTRLNEFDALKYINSATTNPCIVKNSIDDMFTNVTVSDDSDVFETLLEMVSKGDDGK